MSTFAIFFKSSPARCVWLPTPADAKVSSPGLDLANATNCCTDATRTDGCTASAYGPDDAIVIGANVFRGSGEDLSYDEGDRDLSICPHSQGPLVVTSNV